MCGDGIVSKLLLHSVEVSPLDSCSCSEAKQVQQWKHWDRAIALVTHVHQGTLSEPFKDCASPARHHDADICESRLSLRMERHFPKTLDFDLTVGAVGRIAAQRNGLARRGVANRQNACRTLGSFRKTECAAGMACQQCFWRSKVLYMLE